MNGYTLLAAGLLILSACSVAAVIVSVLGIGPLGALALGIAVGLLF